jgi:hypothetical protein
MMDPGSQDPNEWRFDSWSGANSDMFPLKAYQELNTKVDKESQTTLNYNRTYALRF